MVLFAYLFLFVLFFGVAMQWWLAHRHIRYIGRHSDRVPTEFVEKVPLAAHQKAAAYTSTKTRLGIIDMVFNAMVLLCWTIMGGLQYLYSLWEGLNWPVLWTDTAVLLSFLLITSLLYIPLSVYRVFGVEQFFGFNKMSVKTFISDIGKNIFLTLTIGLLLIVIILLLMSYSGQYWWLYVWLAWLGFSLLATWAYPAFIAPLFNKFKALTDADLRQRIEHLLSRNGFKSQGIYVMDGSSRSSHGNAYFTGLGRHKRIVFFDTLIEQLSHDEIEAVLAHELGHFKCRHIVKRMCILGLVFFVGFALLAWLINTDWFFHGLGVSSTSNAVALILFVLVAPVFTLFLQPMFSWYSRQHEFEADDFAASEAHTDHLITALVSLYRENGNTLTPEPLYSAFHDSHPPAPIRIAHLKDKLAT